MAQQRQVNSNGSAPLPARRRPAAGAGQDAFTLTPKEIVAILRRHVFMTVFLTVLGFIIGGVSWYLLYTYAPKYTAMTQIRVLSPIDKDPVTITQVMAQKDILYGNRISIAMLITSQSQLRELVTKDIIQKTKWFESFGPPEPKEKAIMKAVKDLKKHFRAYAQRDADFVTVSMTCGDKKEAALIVNQMVDMFIGKRRVDAGGDVAGKKLLLMNQSDITKKELSVIEGALDSIRIKYNIRDLEEHQYQHTITIRLNDLTVERNDLVLEIEQIRSIVKKLQEQATGEIEVQVKNLVETDPTMIAITQRLTAQRATLTGRLAKFGENHREVRQLKELISGTETEWINRRQEIAELTRQANVENAKDNLGALEDRKKKVEEEQKLAQKEKDDLDKARAEYVVVKERKDAARKRLDEIDLAIGKFAMMQKDPETAKVLSVGPAPEPIEVSSPKWKMYFPGGTILGFLLGIGLAFLIELLNDLVRTPRDVVRYLRIALLGVIPDAAEDDQVDGIDLCRVVTVAPYSLISESYRRFRTNLRLSSSAESAKVLLVSSGMAGDGNTSVAVNLAATLVDEHKKVLLIDANFRKPSLRKLFENKTDDTETQVYQGPGLSDLLSGRCDYTDALRANVVEGLDLVDSGQLPLNPTELLGSSQMQQFIQDRRNEYDYVIIDGPPVLLVSDAKILARFADGTVLVFNAAATKRGAAQRTIRELREVDAVIVGCVLFSVRSLKGGYFQEQFKFYQEYQKLQLAQTA